MVSRRTTLAVLTSLLVFTVGWGTCPSKDGTVQSDSQCDYCGTCEIYPISGTPYVGIKVETSGIYHDTPRKGEYVKVKVNAEPDGCFSMSFKMPRPDADEDGPDFSIQTNTNAYDEYKNYPEFSMNTTSSDHTCKNATKVSAKITDARGCVCSAVWPTGAKGYFEPGGGNTAPDPPDPPKKSSCSVSPLGPGL